MGVQSLAPPIISLNNYYITLTLTIEKRLPFDFYHHYENHTNHLTQFISDKTHFNKFLWWKLWNSENKLRALVFDAILWGNSPYKKGWPLVLVHCTMKRSANKDDDGKKTHGRVRRGGNLHVITANGGSFPASMSLKPYYEASPKWPHTIFGIEDLIKVPSYWPFFTKMEVIHIFWRNCSIKCRKNTLFFRVLPGISIRKSSVTTSRSSNKIYTLLLLSETVVLLVKNVASTLLDKVRKRQ